MKLKRPVVEKQEKDHILADLWDQVYCSLTDAGDRNTNELMGKLSGRNKYDWNILGTNAWPGPKGYNVLSIDLEKPVKTTKSTTKKGTATLKRVSADPEWALHIADVYGLDYKMIPGKRLDLYIPEDEGVRYDLLQGPLVDRVRKQNGDEIKKDSKKMGEAFESDQNNPSKTDSKAFDKAWKQLMKTDRAKYFKAIDKINTLYGDIEDLVKKLPEDPNKAEFVKSVEAFDKAIQRQYDLVNDMASKLLKESLNEDIASSMPVTPLSTEAIIDFIENVPQTTQGRPPYSFKLGYIRDMSAQVKAQYKGGRGSEGNPEVKVFKFSEPRVYLADEYEKTALGKDNMEKAAAGEKDTGERTGFSFSGDNSIRGKVGTSSLGNTQLQAYYVDSNENKPVPTKYYISFDNSDLEEIEKEDLREYMIDSFFADRLNDDIRRMARFNFSGIYKLGNLGQSIINR